MTRTNRYSNIRRRESLLADQNMFESDWSDADRLMNPDSDSNEESEDGFMNSSRYQAQLKSVLNNSGTK